MEALRRVHFKRASPIHFTNCFFFFMCLHILACAPRSGVRIFFEVNCSEAALIWAYGKLKDKEKRDGMAHLWFWVRFMH